jgi:hypothetical protein
MRANAELDIGAPKADQLGRPQACLNGKPKQRVVTPPGPSRPSGGGKQCVQFRFSQESNEPSVEALWHAQSRRQARDAEAWRSGTANAASRASLQGEVLRQTRRIRQSG